MGQYWYVVNLDKKEFVNPHRLGAGLKLWEQLANHPGTGAALVVLCAAMPERRGGGDFDLDENWHGPERVDMSTDGPMPEEYPAIAKRTIGRWAGDRIALVGDYAEDGDLAPEHKASTIYGRCQADTETVWSDDPTGASYSNGMVGDPNYGKYAHYVETKPAEFLDVSDDVAAVIEHELNGKYEGTGWRHFETAGR